MSGFVCCNCEARFPESAALQSTAPGGFVEFCCPNCGSDEIEDAVNLDTIQTMKREARGFRSEFDALVSTGEERYRADMQAAGRGHLVRT
jgi:transcription initiation factor IIE alpha subunit